MDFEGKLCPYCKTEIKNTDEVVVCSGCEMPHHKDCWIENQSCTTFGCTGTMQGINQRNESPSTIYCTRCGKPNKSTDKFCPSCGSPLISNYNASSGNSGTYSVQYQQSTYYNPQINYSTNQSYGQNQNHYQHSNQHNYNNQYISNYQGWNNMGNLSLFLQEKDGFYIKKFQKIQSTGSSITWNWPAFLFGSFWAFYRKLYGIGWALTGAGFILALIPGLGKVSNFILSIIVGMYANKLYMDRANNEIKKSNIMEPTQRALYLNNRGGTSTTAAVLAVAGYFIFWIIVASL